VIYYWNTRQVPGADAGAPARQVSPNA